MKSVILFLPCNSYSGDMATILELPNELQEMIIRFLPAVDLCSVEMCSSSLRALVVGQDLWRKRAELLLEWAEEKVEKKVQELNEVKKSRFYVVRSNFRKRYNSCVVEPLSALLVVEISLRKKLQEVLAGEENVKKVLQRLLDVMIEESTIFKEMSRKEKETICLSK